VRDYGKVASTFWTGKTGREMRADREAQVVAMYLLTGPLANMIGLYHLPVALLSDHTGIPFKGASKALRRVCDTGFSRFEGVLEHVFVPEMAAYQIGEPLSVKDLRVKGIISMWQTYRKSPFYMDFHFRYAASFHLPDPSPLEGASKPLRSQEQEQEQEQEQDQEQEKKRRRAAFVPPTEADVRAYGVRAGKPIDAAAFVAYYASKGWLVGKAKMVDWERAVDGWHSRDQKSGTNGSTSATNHRRTGTASFDPARHPLTPIADAGDGPGHPGG
jgi:hypothetical protein